MAEFMVLDLNEVAHYVAEKARKELTNMLPGTTILPVVELLAGLAEEASELAQASLKLRRVYDGTNPTPKTEGVAIDDLYEEVADVMLYVDQLKLNIVDIDRIKGEKMNRWLRRLEQK